MRRACWAAPGPVNEVPAIPCQTFGPDAAHPRASGRYDVTSAREQEGRRAHRTPRPQQRGGPRHRPRDVRGGNSRPPSRRSPSGRRVAALGLPLLRGHRGPAAARDRAAGRGRATSTRSSPRRGRLRAADPVARRPAAPAAREARPDDPGPRCCGRRTSRSSPSRCALGDGCWPTRSPAHLSPTSPCSTGPAASSWPPASTRCAVRVHGARCGCALASPSRTRRALEDGVAAPLGASTRSSGTMSATTATAEA